MSFIDKLTACNHFNQKKAYPFYVEQMQIGWIKHDNACTLAKWGNEFLFDGSGITLNPVFSDYETRTQFMAHITSELRKSGDISAWQGETYNIAYPFSAQPAFALDRGATSYFGVPSFGTHLNGYTIRNKELYIWVAKRSRMLSFAPGKLDNIAAGGLPASQTPKNNMIKEAWEEAKLVRSVVNQATDSGYVSYLMESDNGITPDTMFVYDLEMDTDTKPQINGDEVDCFECLPARQVYDLVKQTDDFKYNTSLVMIDFLIRKGVIRQNEPTYQQLCAGLRRSFGFQPKRLLQH